MSSNSLTPLVKRTMTGCKHQNISKSKIGHVRLRLIAYPNTDVFLVCFSIINPDSYDNVREKWVPEIMKPEWKAPFLLVGTQMDLRTDPATITNLGEIYNAQTIMNKD